MLFSRRFRDLVDRQLDLFAADHRDDLAELARARKTYDLTDADASPEAFGDYADRVGWAAEELRALRDAYAESVAADAAGAYRQTFARAVRRRLPALYDSFLHDSDLAGEMDDDEDDDEDRR